MSRYAGADARFLPITGEAIATIPFGRTPLRAAATHAAPGRE
jgi:hypothetical protein